MRIFLVGEFGKSDFTPDEEETLRLFSFLTAVKRVLATDGVEEARQRYYKLLKF